MKPKKIRSMSKNDLEEKLKELKLELSKENATIEIGANVKNPGRMGNIKRDIARILTILKEKEGKKK